MIKFAFVRNIADPLYGSMVEVSSNCNVKDHVEIKVVITNDNKNFPNGYEDLMLEDSLEYIDMSYRVTSKRFDDEGNSTTYTRVIVAKDPESVFYQIYADEDEHIIKIEQI